MEISQNKTQRQHFDDYDGTHVWFHTEEYIDFG